MKPTGFVELKSSEILPKLKKMYDYVEADRCHEFADRVNRMIDFKPFWRKPLTLEEAWKYVISDDYGYLLEPGPQQNNILGLIKACSLSETVLINTDQLCYVML